MNEPDSVEAEVRRYYAGTALAAGDGSPACCGPQADQFGAGLYDDLAGLPDAAALASAGCGNPVAVADLHPGEVVLDLGSGGGIDVLLSARRVGPTGKAYGVDFTPEMLDLARRNAAEAGATNVEFLEGRIDAVPLPDGSVDVDHLQLRGQPGRRQGGGVHRDAARCCARAGGSGSATWSPRTGSAPPSGPSAAATSAASPARSRCPTTGLGSKRPGWPT